MVITNIYVMLPDKGDLSNGVAKQLGNDFFLGNFIKPTSPHISQAHSALMFFQFQQHFMAYGCYFVRLAAWNRSEIG